MDSIEEVSIYTEDGELISESKKILGYGGTKKIEKKYNIPDDICIERIDVANCATTMDIVKKATKAVKYIKDPEDINTYFFSLMKSVFYNLMVLKEEQINMHAASKGLYDLYKKSYKGDNPINLKKLFRAVLLKFGGAMAASAGIGAATGTVIGKALVG